MSSKPARLISAPCSSALFRQFQSAAKAAGFRGSGTFLRALIAFFLGAERELSESMKQEQSVVMNSTLHCKVSEQERQAIDMALERYRLASRAQLLRLIVRWYFAEQPPLKVARVEQRTETLVERIVLRGDLAAFVRGRMQKAGATKMLPIVVEALELLRANPAPGG